MKKIVGLEVQVQWKRRLKHLIQIIFFIESKEDLIKIIALKNKVTFPLEIINILNQEKQKILCNFKKKMPLRFYLNSWRIQNKI